MSPGYGASRPVSPSMALRPYGGPPPSLDMSAQSGAMSRLPPPSLYSPQTPLSPFDSQQVQAQAQIQAMQLQRQQQQHAAGIPSAQMQMFGYPSQGGTGTMGRSRSGSNAMAFMQHHRPTDMNAFDDDAGTGAQMYHPRMDHVTGAASLSCLLSATIVLTQSFCSTAAYVRGGSPHTGSGPSQQHLQHYPSGQMVDRNPFQGSERFDMSGTHASHLDAEQDFDVEQEVNIKTKLKTRGKGWMHGQGQGSQQASAYGSGMFQEDWQDPSTHTMQLTGHIPQQHLQRGMMRKSTQPAPGHAAGTMGYGQDAAFIGYGHRAPSPF